MGILKKGSIGSLKMGEIFGGKDKVKVRIESGEELNAVVFHGEKMIGIAGFELVFID